MVYIAVKKIPMKVSLQSIIKYFSKIIKQEFEVLNFGPVPKQSGIKTCYLLVPKNAHQVIESINRFTKYSAVVTNYVPDLPQRQPRKGKGGQRKAEITPYKVFAQTHTELLIEMQSKYTGLYNLSRKTGHKLLDAIAKKVFERLKEVSDSNPDALETGFKLSSAYRRLHPHFGDFTLILSTLHRLQDAVGAPRTQMVESDLISDPSLSAVNNRSMDMGRVQAISSKYAEKIVQKIKDHVNNLDADFGASDSDENLAQKKVREELKNLSPYLPLIVRDVINNHFLPRKTINLKVRIYGEPFLPNKEAMFPIVKRIKGAAIMRSDRMYNLLRLSIPPKNFKAFMAIDGTVVGAAKLVARSSDMPLYNVPHTLIKEMRAEFGMETTDADDLDIAEELEEAGDMDVEE